MPSPERSADTPYQGSRGQQGGSAGRPDRGSAGSGRPRLPTTQLSYDTPDNGRATRTVAIGPAEPGQANSPIRARWLTVFPGGARLLQRYVPRAHAGSGDWTPYDQLDNEIRAALRLARILGHDRYPEEIVELVGFDVDAVEPFLLLTAYRGEPVSQLAGSLLIDAQRAFRVSLFRSLRLLDAAGVVHRAISPHTVRWDGHQVQIVDLTAMTLAGEPRGVAGAAPWASPEQLSGQGEADPRDDVWSAGVLTSYVSTGEPVTERSQPADLLVDDPSLRRLLGDVFGPAAGRPDAATMLRRLNAGQPAVPPPGSERPPRARPPMRRNERRVTKLAESCLMIGWRAGRASAR